MRRNTHVILVATDSPGQQEAADGNYLDVQAVTNLLTLLVASNDGEVSAPSGLRRFQNPGELALARFRVRHFPGDLNQPLDFVPFRHDKIALARPAEVRQFRVRPFPADQFKVNGIFQLLAVIVGLKRNDRRAKSVINHVVLARKRNLAFHGSRVNVKFPNQVDGLRPRKPIVKIVLGHFAPRGLDLPVNGVDRKPARNRRHHALEEIAHRLRL